jgi:hypothetical protein
MKLAASTKRLRESRAAHITAKAMGARPEKPEVSHTLSGVWGATGKEGMMRNRRDPSVQPESGRSVAYKPEVKVPSGQRESEGVIVLKMIVPQNTIGGKGLCGERIVEEGKCEGMPFIADNYPTALECSEKVRELQNRLWITAKRDVDRRFHALYDRIYRSDVLWEAWKWVRRNGGAAGVDKETLVEVAEYGAERLLNELHLELREI